MKELKAFSVKFIQLSKKAMDNLTTEERHILQKLQKDETIVITKQIKETQ